MCAAGNHNIRVASANHHCRFADCLRACRTGRQAASYRPACAGEHRKMSRGHIRLPAQARASLSFAKAATSAHFAQSITIGLVIPAGRNCAEEILVDLPHLRPRRDKFPFACGRFRRQGYRFRYRYPPVCRPGPPRRRRICCPRLPSLCDSVFFIYFVKS